MNVDPKLLSIALRPNVEGWSWYSFVTCTLGDHVITVFGQLSDATDIVLLCPMSLEDGELLNNFLGQRIDIKPCGEVSTHWSASILLDARRNMFFSGKLTALRLADAERTPPAYYRIVFQRIKLAGYSSRLWLATSESSAKSVGYTALTVLGREAILSELAVGESTEECFVALSFEGDFLPQLDLDAVEMTLYLLAGVVGIRKYVEAIDANFRWVSTSMHRLGHATDRSVELIFPSAAYVERDFYLKVSRLIEYARTLIRHGVPLRAFLFHIFLSQQIIPEIKITHLAIALDGINQAVVEKIRGEGNLLEPDVFRRRIRPVVEAARVAFSDPQEVEILEHVVRRIEESNNWSINKRWKRFWRDYISYTLAPEEESVLRHRGSAIHNAYILLTEYDLAQNPDGSLDRRPYEVRLGELARDANIYRNVVNRVLLTLLNYTGPFRDFAHPNERSLLSLGSVEAPA